MRSDMLKKVQSAGSGTQSRPPSALGKLPAAETGTSSLQNDPDSPSTVENHETAGCCKGTDRASSKTGCTETHRGNIFVGAVILFIRIYQKTLSPLLPECCRFEPTCSRYAVEAFQVHGFWKGMALTVWRLMRCQPFSRGGYDPVPPRRHHEAAGKSTSSRR